MKYINLFSQLKNNYFIYKLNSGDCVIKNFYINKNVLIILYGTIRISRIFNNQKIVFLSILSQNHIVDIDIIHNKDTSRNYYYQLMAIETTYLISFNQENLYKEINRPFYKSLNTTYKLTLNRYTKINHILAHKHTKHKLIQICLFFSLEFGTMHKTYTFINFPLSKKQISIMIGCNNNTLNYHLTLLNTLLNLNFIKRTISWHNIFNYRK